MKRRKKRFEKNILKIFFLLILLSILGFGIYKGKNLFNNSDKQTTNSNVTKNDKKEKNQDEVYKLKLLATGDGLIHSVIYRSYAKSDGSYDFYNIDKFIEGLEAGYDLVVGNRFKGGIKKGAMSISHKIGVRFLSDFSNFFFHTPIKDYHCGLRAYKKESIEKINLTQKGMEYASEMIILSKLNNLKMLEVPTVLRKDLREKKSHLRTIRDGIRHLNLICTIALNKNKYIVKG